MRKHAIDRLKAFREGKMSEADRVKLFLGIFLVVQVILLALFLGKWIREPYPALILPAFEQTLHSARGEFCFTIPEIEIRCEEQPPRSLSLDQIKFRGVSSERAYWLFAEHGIPALSSSEIKPSLPTFMGYRADSRAQDSFLKWVARSVDQSRVCPSPPRSAAIVWRRKTFQSERGNIIPIKHEELGRLQLPLWRQ